MNSEERSELSLKLRTIFKPSTPINRFDLFMGRQQQSRKLLAALNQNGQHAILFGERGVGKTSLANVLMFQIRSPGWPIVAPIVNATRQDSYSVLWGRLFVELDHKLKAHKIKLPAWAARYVKYSQEGIHDPITPDAVCRVLSAAAEKALVVAIIDEFDTLQSQDVRSAMADTIKYLSDRNAPCTVIIIGVSDDVEGLIEEHHSVERCLAQIRMPRMSRDELEEIVTKSLYVAGMQIENGALHEISRISKGLPHYAHLLGLHSAINAVDNDTHKVVQSHVSKAIAVAIEDSYLPIQQAYLKATDSSQQTALYCEVLLAAALADTNEFGYFGPTDVRGPLSKILKKTAKIESFARHLHAFCEERLGPVLRKSTIKSRPRFRFLNPLMQPYVIMRGIRDGLLTEADLQATRDLTDPQQRLF